MSRRKPAKLKRRKAGLSWPQRFDLAAVEALEPWLGGTVSRGIGSVGKLADEPPLIAFSAAVLLLAGALIGIDRKSVV